MNRLFLVFSILLLILIFQINPVSASNNQFCQDSDNEGKDPTSGPLYELYKIENHHKIAGEIKYTWKGEEKSDYDKCKGVSVLIGPDKGRHYVVEMHCEDFIPHCSDTGSNEDCTLEPTVIISDNYAMCPCNAICKNGACVIPDVVNGDPPPPCGIDDGGTTVSTDNCKEDTDDNGDYFVGGVTTYIQDGQWVSPLADYCLNDNIVLEYSCDKDGLINNQHECPNGCETIPYAGITDFQGTVGQCFIEKTCTDFDDWAPVIKAYVLGVEVGSYNTEHSIPSGSSQTGKDGKTYNGCEDTCIDSDGNPANESNKLKECHCDGIEVSSNNFTCPDYSNGCINGACCFNAEICMDLDEGPNKNKYGSTFFSETCNSNMGDSHYDTCGVAVCSNLDQTEEIEDGEHYNCPKHKDNLHFKKMGKIGDAVFEYYCSDFNSDEKGEILSKWIACDPGSICIKGECVPGGQCKKYVPGQSMPRYNISIGENEPLPQMCVEGILIDQNEKASEGIYCNSCIDTDKDGIEESFVSYKCGRPEFENGDVVALENTYVKKSLKKCPVFKVSRSKVQGGCSEALNGCIPILPLKENTMVPKKKIKWWPWKQS